MTMAYLTHCDGRSPDCIEQTDIYFTPKHARQAAKRGGWKRVKNEKGKMIDLCPMCYAHRKNRQIIYVPVTYP